MIVRDLNPNVSPTVVKIHINSLCEYQAPLGKVLYSQGARCDDFKVMCRFTICSLKRRYVNNHDNFDAHALLRVYNNRVSTKSVATENDFAL